MQENAKEYIISCLRQTQRQWKRRIVLNALHDIIAVCAIGLIVYLLLRHFFRIFVADYILTSCLLMLASYLFFCCTRQLSNNQAAMLLDEKYQLAQRVYSCSQLLFSREKSIFTIPILEDTATHLQHIEKKVGVDKNNRRSWSWITVMAILGLLLAQHLPQMEEKENFSRQILLANMKQTAKLLSAYQEQKLANDLHQKIAKWRKRKILPQLLAQDIQPVIIKLQNKLKERKQQAKLTEILKQKFFLNSANKNAQLDSSHFQNLEKNKLRTITEKIQKLAHRQNNPYLKKLATTISENDTKKLQKLLSPYIINKIEGLQQSLNALLLLAQNLSQGMTSKTSQSFPIVNTEVNRRQTKNSAGDFPQATTLTDYWRKPHTSRSIKQRQFTQSCLQKPWWPRKYNKVIDRYFQKRKQ